MCVKEFIGFNCGHCALPTLRACPIASQSPHFPYCRYPAERPIPLTENCPSCARVLWNQRTLANEESHREVHYRLGREECAFDSEKGSCETRFDIDIEKEGGGGGRQIRRAGHERVMEPVRMQIEAHCGNAEISESGIGAAIVRRKVTKKDRRKSSREIEEAIARVEARFAAINMESSRQTAIEDALRSAGQDYVAAPSRSDNDPELHVQQTLLDSVGDLQMETEYQASNYHSPKSISGPGQLSSSDASSPHFGPRLPPGNAHIGYQFGNEAVGLEALPDRTNLIKTKDKNDSGRQVHAARLSGERKYGVQNYIGTTKYYPGEEQYRGAPWDVMIADVKYKPDSVVPRGPRAEQERSVGYQGAAQQSTSQMPPPNYSEPALRMNAPPVDDFHGSQSTLPEEIGAAARRPKSYDSQTDPPTSANYSVFDGVNEHSPLYRSYRGPAIVSSDMANTGYT
ncbi:hypothetical protein V493_01440 [Pseudogymnoascus sp. VKM F-4281 (FW-2241)]|nr:hypothetical protein V493_01440 [Pseudogymnoascus sp. VKM F-4281 (FW-2241)]